MPEPREINRRLGDPYAFALLQWPCVVLLLELPGGLWWAALKVVLATWLAVSTLAAFFGRYRGAPRFGLCLVLCLGLVALFWTAHPGAWQFLWLLGLPIAFFAAQRALLAELLAEERPGP